MKMNRLFIIAIACLIISAVDAQKNMKQTIPLSPEEMRSQENQVFQFMQSGTCTAWADSVKTNSTLYLWVPENCKQIKGLLIMGSNVPEHFLVGDTAIRKVCATNNLGIIWSTPSFLNTRRSTTKDNKQLNMALEYKTTNEFLQQLLNGLAETSGYPEVATVPWIPMGESGHLLMVDALMEYNPDRCMAGIFIKNNHLPPHNRKTPTLVAFGSSQEWGQDKVDMRNRWNDIEDAYKTILTQRKLNPEWPLSYVIDGTSGHFDCTERLASYFAHYIDVVAKARLSDNGSPNLKPIKLEKGFLADLPVPGHENKPIKSFSSTDTAYLSSPWYFDRYSALEAQSIAHINWKAATQLPGFLTDSGKIAPFIFNGISKFSPAKMGEDGLTFTVKGIMLDELPQNFIGAGEKLPKTNTEPIVEWVCGQFKPLGNNMFRISLDRSWPNTANYIGVRQRGSDTIRPIFQPCGLTLPKNTTGTKQQITFNKLEDVAEGTKSVPLVASTDANLPVNFYVVAGPAIIDHNQLVFTKIPPKSKFPVSVTVAAWQWGKNTEPKIKMADIVKQTFKINKR